MLAYRLRCSRRWSLSLGILLLLAWSCRRGQFSERQPLASLGWPSPLSSLLAPVYPGTRPPARADELQPARLRGLLNDFQLPVLTPVQQHSHHAPMQLLNGYSNTMDMVREELRLCGPGDEILFSIYVCEPGATSEAVIEELEHAAKRGAKVTLRTDCSVLSSFTRLCEGTTTLVHRLRALSAAMPHQVSFEPPEIPTHAKVLVFRRANDPDVAIFGGINLGDRFQSWHDFAVRVSGSAAVAALLSALGWEQHSGSTDELRQLSFVTNHPKTWEWPAWLLRSSFAGEFHVVSAMASFFADPRFSTYRVAAAYVDDSGAELLSLALARGAKVEIVLPRAPNVYGDCNARTLGLLLGRWGQSGQLTIRLHSAMLHAKAAVAEGPSGSAARAGFIGSCNLKWRSFTQFEELNAFVTDQAFCESLWQDLGALLREAEEVHSPEELPFSPVAACLQDYFG